LAFQVKRELEWLYAKTGAKLATCVGGMDYRDEKRTLDRGAHIVVGTPGRLRDHIQRGSLDMSGLRVVVLDEADEMLDLGFRDDLEFMLGEAPESRRTLMFSATVPAMIAKLAKQYQKNGVRVNTAAGAKQHADISYQALSVHQRDEENAIINMLRYHDADNAIVFCNTRASVARLTARFGNRGFPVVCLSGELSQAERSHALQSMRDGRARVCVATDVAARGIDLPNLELVIHAELPTNAETLLHRSGRTGRAGRKGISALIVPPKFRSKATRLLGWAKVQAEWVEAPSAEMILRKDEEKLLNDPALTADPSAEEAEFAAKMMAIHTPEKIAAAYLRLYRAGVSAPEEIGAAPAPGERPERKPREDFGPSVWFSISVGRDDRAEPRWLLPLACRAGKIDKNAIGAIRIRDAISYIELKATAADGFEAALDNGILEDKVRATRLSEAPDLGGDRGGPRSGGGKKPYEKKSYGDKKPYEKKSYGDKKTYEKKAYGDKKPYDKADGGKPRAKKPFVKDNAEDITRDGAVTDKARKPRVKDRKPYEGGDKPQGGKKPYAGKPGGGKPYAGKFGAGKSGGSKPYAGKPAAGGKPKAKFGKPSH
jgi:ATP-dependent RNA helicase DeaD